MVYARPGLDTVILKIHPFARHLYNKSSSFRHGLAVVTNNFQKDIEISSIYLEAMNGNGNDLEFCNFLFSLYEGYSESKDCIIDGMFGHANETRDRLIFTKV